MVRSIIRVGNAVPILHSLPRERFRIAVTSPPYWGLRNYSTEHVVWGGKVGCKHTWVGKQTPRPNQGGGLTKKQSSNLGSFAVDNANRVAHSAACEKCGAWRGELGQESSPESYIEHLVSIFREVRNVLTNDGSLWVVIGDSFYGDMNKWNIHDLKPGDMVGIPWMLAFAMRADGWYLRSECIWHKPNAFPEGGASSRPHRDHETLFLFTKLKRYHYDRMAVLQPLDNPTRNLRTVWKCNVRGFKGSHCATFPPDLIRPCILASSEEGDHVLDPFCGAGTVGVVCQETGRHFSGIEINEEYAETARKRLGLPVDGIGQEQYRSPKKPLPVVRGRFHIPKP